MTREEAAELVRAFFRAKDALERATGGFVEVQFALGYADYPDLDADQWIRLVELGPELFWPGFFGVSGDVWRAYTAMFNGHVQCSGITKKGARCRHPAWGNPPYSLRKPQDFVLGIHDRCELHRERRT